MVGSRNKGADHNVALPGHAVGVQEADVGLEVVVGVAAVGEAQQQLLVLVAQQVDGLAKPLFGCLKVAVKDFPGHCQHWLLCNDQVA